MNAYVLTNYGDDEILVSYVDFTLHTHQMVASTWLGDHQGRPSAPTISL